MPFYTPAADAVQLAQHGMQIRNQMQQIALQERELDQQQEQQKFARRLQEAQMAHELLSDPRFRPVDNGTYESTMPGASGLPTSSAMDAIGALRSGDISKVQMAPADTVATRAPIRPGSTLDWNGRQFAALSPDEQLQQRISAGRSEVLANAAAADEVRLRFGVAPPAEVADLYPSGFKVTNAELAREVPAVMANRRSEAKDTARTARDEQKQREQQTFQGEQNRLNRENQVKVANIRASHDRGPTPGQAGVQGRFDQRELDAGMKQHDALQEQEQQQHELRTGYGQALNIPNGEAFIDPDSGRQQTMNDLFRASLTRRYQAATEKVGDLAERQKKIRQRFGVGEFTPGAQAKPHVKQPATAAPPGRIRVKLSTGQTGTVDVAEFDPKTMTQL